MKDENVLSVFNTGTTTDFKVALNQDCVYLVQNENSNITIPSHLRHEWFTCNDARTEEVGSIISLRKSKSELNCHSRWMWSFKKDLEFGLSSEGSVLSGSYVGLKWGYSIEEGRPIVRIIDSDEIPVLFEVITLSEDEMTLRKID